MEIFEASHTACGQEYISFNIEETCKNWITHWRMLLMLLTWYLFENKSVESKVVDDPNIY